MSFRAKRNWRTWSIAIAVITLLLAVFACDLPFSSSVPTAQPTFPPETEPSGKVEEVTATEPTSSIVDQGEFIEISGGEISDLNTEVVVEEETLGRILKVTLTNDAVPQTRMYWTDPGSDKIQRAYVGSPDAQDLVVEDLLEPNGIALDLFNMKMYWADGGTGKIQRANLDGSLLEDIIIEDGKYPFGITLSVPADFLYWTELNVSTLSRSDLEGMNAETPLLSFLNTPHGVAFDQNLGTLFWTESIALRKSTSNGGNLENVVAGVDQIRAIALDPIERNVYWTENGKIRRAGYDGLNPEDLITDIEGPSLGIALDLREGKMYWTEFDAGKIMRANLDGTEMEEVIVGLVNPSGIALEFIGDAYVRIPCGTVFEPGGEDAEDGKQRLMVIQEASAVVPAGGQAELDPFVVCIDSNRGIPNQTTEYSIGAPASGDLMKLAQCICQEKLVSEEEDPMLNLGQQAGLQLSVWQVAGGFNMDELLSESEIAGGDESALGSYSEFIQLAQEMMSTFPQYVDWLEACQVEAPE